MKAKKTSKRKTPRASRTPKARSKTPPKKGASKWTVTDKKGVIVGIKARRVRADAEGRVLADGVTLTLPGPATTIVRS